MMLSAVLFKSEERFQSFRRAIEEQGVKCTILDFEKPEWLEFDYGKINFIVYYPSFKYSSNYPLSLYEACDNLEHIRTVYPDVRMYPEPNVLKFYNDKYRQYLFLKSHDYPIPETIPLYSAECLATAEDELGFPMVVKNRFGAGGGSVFKVTSRKELRGLYSMSTLNLLDPWSAKYLLKMVKKKMFFYHLLKKKRMEYPFLSPPLLAQEFVKMDRDLKTVVGEYRVVESHWRLQASVDQWKVNIDGGGIGQWSKVPEEAMALSVRLAKNLHASWLNIDLIQDTNMFKVTEFSPVWHHYAYKEKENFVYMDDYNVGVPLEISLNLEKMIVESLIRASRAGKG